MVLGAAESVVGISDAFKPYPERRGLYRPNATRAARPGVAAPQALRSVASAAR
jgi:chemotaxis protein methyltransferase CheR